MKVPAGYEDILRTPAVERVYNLEPSEPLSTLEEPAAQSTQLPPEVVKALRKYAVKKNNLPTQLQALVQGVENK